ncbi:MAG: hypothetical protein ACR2H3_15870 [Acidimicrobiales bacterium]
MIQRQGWIRIFHRCTPLTRSSIAPFARVIGTTILLGQGGNMSGASRWSLLRPVAVALVLSALLAGSSIAAASAATEAEIDTAIAERAELGFVGSPTKVRSLLDGEADPRSAEWGIPLTTAELDDITARATFSNRAKEKAIPYAEALDTFAGAWFDQKDDGKLVIMLTDATDAAKAAVRERMPDQSRGVRFMPAKYGFAKLQSAFDRAWEAWAKEHPGMLPTGVTIDVPNNRLILEVAADDVARAKDQIAGLEKEFGVDIAVRQGTRGRDLACPSRAKCYDPLRAGTRVYNAYANNTSHFCTMAFHVNDSTQNNAWDHTFFTAGHCAYDPVTGAAKPDDWHQDSAFGLIGNEKKNGYVSNNRDIMLVKFQDWADQKSSRVYGASGSGGQVMSEAVWPHTGDYACTSLGKSGEVRCGTVVQDYAWFSETKKITVQGAALNWSNSIPDLLKGDSGSPVYAFTEGGNGSNILFPMGVVDHERVGNYDALFAKVKWAMNNWDLSIYTGTAND